MKTMPGKHRQFKAESYGERYEFEERGGGEVFSPEAELKQLKQMPKAEKRMALEKFKERLIRQKEGIAEMQGALMEAARDNPDISIEELHKRADDFVSKYQLDARQKIATSIILRDYVVKHRKIREIREQYPDDKDLFSVLFGRKPQGKIEIIEGPMTLYFRCYDPADYALLRFRVFLTGRNIKSEEIDVANRTAGSFVNYSLVPGLEGVTLAENAGRSGEEVTRRGIYLHEERHALNWLIDQQMEKQLDWALYASEFRVAKDDESRKRILRWYLRGVRTSILSQSKDEILAYLKDGRFSLEEILIMLTKSKFLGGIYDYATTKKNDLLDMWLEGRGRKYVRLMEEVIDEIFVVEYQELLKNGVSAIEKLRMAGFGTDKIINVLIVEPLEKWPRLASLLMVRKSRLKPKK